MAYRIGYPGGLPFSDPTTATPASKVTARTMTEQIVATTMGSAIPYVVGTGRVDGLYFIGGIVTETITTYTEKEERVPDVFDRVHFSTPTYTTVPTGSPRYTLSAPGIKIDLNNYRTVTVEEQTTRQTAHVGYILAYDHWERGYDLIRLEVAGETVFDTENGIGANVQFRFYGGRQDRVDDLLTDLIGDNAGAYQNFVMVFLEGYESSSAPSVQAVISNAATDQAEDVVIEWTGTPPPDPLGEVSSGRMAAYDPSDNVIYHLISQVEIPGVSAVWLVVLDPVTHLESYRVPLEDTADYVGLGSLYQISWSILAIRGSGHVLVRLGGPETPYPDVNRIYNAATGAIVGEYAETPGMGEKKQWQFGMPFGDKYVFIGFISRTMDDNMTFMVVDVATGSIDVFDDNTIYTGNLSRGRTQSGTVSFFGADADTPPSIHEYVFDGADWTRSIVYTSASDTITGLWYDPGTGYLVSCETELVGGVDNYHVRVVNPDDGAIISSLTSLTDSYYTAVTDAFVIPHYTLTVPERYWPRPGFAMMYKAGSVGNVHLFSIEENAIALYAEDAGFSNAEFQTSIFDQNKLTWYQVIEDVHWVEHFLPNQLPGLVDLDAIVTDVMSLAGFVPEDLFFDGFAGLSSYGLVIQSDTNIQAVMRSIADVYDFSFCDTGSGFVFKKPGRDDVATIDATFAAVDLVERAGGVVQSRDEANLRTPGHVEFEYVSKDARYQVRPTSFTMPTGVLPSLMVERFSTPILMTDASAQQLVTERFFESQQDRRDHNCIVAPQHVTLLPGDIVSIPSGDLNFIARINSIALELRNMSLEINAIDFQTEVAAEITSVSNNVGVLAQFSLATQYIHLDIPLYDYADDLGGAALVQYGMLASKGAANWAGGVLYSGAAPTDLTAKFNQAPHGGVIGVSTDVLAAPPVAFESDFVNTVTIRVTSGDSSLLVDRTEDEVLEGANLCAIGQEGRWELAGFMTVEDNGDGSFTLSDFAVRGYRGSEVFADQHAVGDLFVLLNLSWLRRVAHPLADLDHTYYYKAAGAGQNPADLTVLPHVIPGTAETPYASRNLDAVAGTPDGIDISWDYRSRLAEGLNPSNHGEATLAFEIDILDPVTLDVVRTLTATTNSVHYAHADVVADFGSDPPAQLAFDVYMMSAVVGRGYRARRSVVLIGAELSGQAVTVSVGTVTVAIAAVNVTAPVTGQAAGVSVGDVTVSAASGVTATVTGLAAGVSVGTVVAGVLDPYFSSVVLLIGADGTDGSTTILDESGFHRTLTVTGSVQIDTAQSKFGGSSLVYDGSGDRLGAADSLDWQLSTSNSSQFTVELWVRLNVFQNGDNLVGQFGSAGTFAWAFTLLTGGELRYTSSANGTSFNTTVDTSGAGITTGTGYAVAVDKDATGKVRIYVDGVMKGSGTPADSSIFNSTQILGIGASSSAANIIDGWIDELRITKGVARYASDSGYTVTTTAFPRG